MKIYGKPMNCTVTLERPPENDATVYHPEIRPFQERFPRRGPLFGITFRNNILYD